MAKIEDLIAQIPDERLRKGIAAEVKVLKKTKKFGLGYCQLNGMKPKWSHFAGIVKLSEFDQNLGNTRIHNSLIFRHLGYRSKVEN
jgi:hypothetical protein